MRSQVLQTFVTDLLPPHDSGHLTAVTIQPDDLRLQRTTTAPTACCARCAVPSASVHRRYQRQLTDVPWGTRAVRIRLTGRTCVCRHPTGRRRLCTERLPALVAASARHTTRLITALRVSGGALGGQAGARLAARRRLPTRAAPRLRLVRAASGPQIPSRQAVGVEEWAWRRGHRSGTMLVDLAPPRVVALRPDRAAATVAAWLAQPPTITAGCRDRRPLDADGLRRGAPEAVQVVARVPRVANRREAVAACWRHQRGALQAAAGRPAQALTPPGSAVPVTPLDRGRRQRLQPQSHPAHAARPHRHAPWRALDEALHARQAPGTPVATIARQLGSSRPTVEASRRRDMPPGPKRPQCHRSAQVWTPSRPSRIHRWRESRADSAPLWRESRARGYTPAARTVSHVITS